MKEKFNVVVEAMSGIQGKPVENLEAPKCQVVKLKGVSKDTGINYEETEELRYDKVMPKYLLRKGDILFKAKSGDNIAAIVDRDVENLVATSHFIIMRIKEEYKDKILPEYLTMYLNSEYAQEYFKARSEGSVLPIIKLSTLNELEIIVPDMPEQERLCELYALMLEEKVTMQKLMMAREKQMTGKLREVLEKEL